MDKKRITKKHMQYVRKICESNTVKHSTIYKALLNSECDYDMFCDAFSAKQTLYNILKNGDINEILFEVGTLADIYEKYHLDVYEYKDILNKAYMVIHEIIKYYSKNINKKDDKILGIASAICLMDHVTMPYTDLKYINNICYLPSLISDTLSAFTGINIINKALISEDRFNNKIRSIYHYLHYRSDRLFIHLINHLSQPSTKYPDNIYIAELLDMDNSWDIIDVIHSIISTAVEDDLNYIG